jgi:drug/metabolite transporter (DMT)-like permease
VSLILLCFSQALFGKLLFGEALALLWWLGASLIIFGLVFLNYTSKLEQEEALEQEKALKID